MNRKPMLSVFSLALAGLLATGTALAQAPTYGTTQAPPPDTIPAAADRMAPASKTKAVDPSTMPRADVARPLNAQDRKFVGAANEAGAAEVRVAKLAMERASSSDVKDFASRMASDHEKAGAELDKIIASKGAAETGKVSGKDQSELDKLSRLGGPSFDREYVKSQLAAHQAAVALFKKESSSGGDRDLKQFSAATLPTLQDHLQMVQQLSKSPPRAATTSDKLAGAKP